MTITTLIATGDTDLVGLDEVALPDPTPDQATVAVAAASVNRGEILLLEAGRTDGHGKDVSGTVTRPAADGSGPPAGTRVVAHLDGGGWAEQVNVTTDRLVPLPEAVDTEAAATLPLAGLTALRLLRVVQREEARRVLLTGASGGVGHVFCELAAGARIAVTAVSRSPDRGARLLELGAESVVAAVEEAGGDFDVALDSVGGSTTGGALIELRPGGLLVWFGQASGTPAALDFFAVMDGPGAARLESFRYWSDPAADRADLALLVDHVAAGRLHPEIGLRVPWREAPAALAAVRDRGVRGNAVLCIGA